MDKIDYVIKDLPKVLGQPKPSEPLLWSIYLVDTQLRARLHAASSFNKIVWEGSVNDHLQGSLLETVKEWIRRNE